MSYDNTNYSTLDVAADGALTIATVDADAAEGDIILLPDGNVGIGVADPDTHLEILGTTTQLKLSYDADSFSTITVADSSHTTIATGESGNITLDAAGSIFIDAAGGGMRLSDGGATYTPAHASDITTKTYVDTQTVITANFYSRSVNNTTWTLMNNDSTVTLGGTDEVVGNTETLTMSSSVPRALVAIIPYNITVHAISFAVCDDDMESTVDKRLGVWRLPSLGVSGSDPGNATPNSYTLAYISDAFNGTSGKVQALYDASANFALSAGDGIFMGYLNPQSGGSDDVTLTMSIWAHKTTP